MRIKELRSLKFFDINKTTENQEDQRLSTKTRIKTNKASIVNIANNDQRLSTKTRIKTILHSFVILGE